MSDDFGYPDAHTWVLNAPAMSPTDPRSLVTMELRNRKPARWSVRLY